MNAYSVKTTTATKTPSLKSTEVKMYNNRMIYTELYVMPLNSSIRLHSFTVCGAAAAAAAAAQTQRTFVWRIDNGGNMVLLKMHACSSLNH